MTNTELLNEVIKKSGLKREWIAEQLGITRVALAQKINNESEFKISEMRKLTKVLSLSKQQRDTIFLS